MFIERYTFLSEDLVPPLPHQGIFLGINVPKRLVELSRMLAVG